MDQTQQTLLTEYGMDIPTTIARFGGNEALMMRFLLSFENDPTYASLQAAVAENDREQAKATVHALKGLTGNLGLTPLFEASSAMMNTLRTDDACDMAPLFAHVQEEHAKAVATLAGLR